MTPASSIPITSENKEALQVFVYCATKKTQQRGQALASQRHVLSIKRNEKMLEAVVLGSDKQKGYSVHLQFNPERLIGDCTCPYGSHCKHAVAVAKLLINESPIVEDPEKSASTEPTLADLVSKKVNRPLAGPAGTFLKAAERWRQTGNHTVNQNTFLQTLGSKTSWNFNATFEIHPKALPPRDAWDFLAFLAILAKEKSSSLPPTVASAIDPALIEELSKKITSHREIAAWENELAQWQIHAAPARPKSVELKLQLSPGGPVILARSGSETEFTPAKIKTLRECESDLRYGNYDSTLLDAGSISILAILQNAYGAINTLKIEPFSKELTHCLAKLIRTPELLLKHVMAEDGQPIVLSNSPLAWHLKSPAEGHSNYKLDLLDADGRGVPAPIAIIPGEPLHYVCGSGIHPIDRWPFQNRSKPMPMKIPAAALESKTGIRALVEMALPLPPALQSRIRHVPLAIDVRLKFSDLGSAHIQLNASAGTGTNKRHSIWTGLEWFNLIKDSDNHDDEDIVTFPDKSSLLPAASWLKEIPFRQIDHYNDDDTLHFRLIKSWPQQFLDWLAERPDHIKVSLDKNLASLRDGAVAGRVSIDIEESSEIDWFDLSVALKVDDTTLTQEEIDLLLKARGQWVQLGKKGWRKLDFDIPEEQLRELADLGLAAHDFSAEKQRLHALQLGSLAKKNSPLLESARCEQVRRRIEDIQTRVTPPAPSAITATLRPYQLEGFHFLAYLTENRFGGVLADDMGLGKTLQSLCWLEWLRETQKLEGPSLVVCPKSVQDNWRSEAARFLPGIRVEVWNRDSVGKTGLDGATDLLVIHYAQLRSQEEKLRAVRWGAVILDEAQNIKNPTSQNARAACALPAARRLALTGTPIENRLLDLWSIFQFAMPGVLGHRAGFLKNFDRKDDLFARHRLAARTRPFLLRRTKSEVASDLPERVEEDIIVEMEGTQSKLYQAEIKRARAQLLKAQTDKQLDKLRFNILTSLLRLRQICCHPRLLGLDEKPKSKKAEAAPPEEESAKLAALIDLLEPLMEEGQKVVVFSQFLEMLDLAGQSLTAREWKTFRLDGSTEDRGPLVQEFQNHDGPAVFLISLKAGGSGLNLTSAAYVVLFDPWWNPAVEAQAIDRTHRIGQKQTVFAYRLLVKDSIEEKIRRLQKQKGALAKDILGEENFARALSLEDFQFLLGEE